jgi:hypothetical protein
VTSDSPELREAGGSDAIYVTPSETGIASGIITAIDSHRHNSFNWREQSWSVSSATLASALTGQVCSKSKF